MLLDKCDIELLRLTGWCKNLPAGLDKLFSGSLSAMGEIRAMEVMGYLYQTSKGDSFRLRPAGYELLSHLEFPCPKDSKYVSEAKTLESRRRAALILLTFYRAGFDVFLDTQSQLRAGAFLPYAALRRNNRQDNPFPGLHLMGVGRSRKQSFFCYYPDGSNLIWGTEKTAIAKLAAGSEARVLFCSEDYGELARMLLGQDTSPGKKGAVSYGAVYASADVRLLACGDAGAAQLLLSREDCRARIAQYILGGQYSPPPKGSLCDALYQGKYPVLICVDMDISRIKRACSPGIGKGGIIVIAFKEQLPAIAALCAPLRPELFGADWRELLEQFGCPLYDPPEEAYLTEKGSVVNLASLQRNRKTGKQGGRPHKG